MPLTAAKNRYAMVKLCSPAIAKLLPIPTGTVNAFERQQFEGVYSGLTPSGGGGGQGGGAGSQDYRFDMRQPGYRKRGIP